MKVFISLALVFLSGCASIETAVSKRSLEVQNKMSATIFLDPAETEQEKNIYLQVRNTSDQKDFSLEEGIGHALVAKGYRVVKDVKHAHYVLQANVLQVGKSSKTAAEAAVYRGYGFDGALAGGSVAYMAGGSEKIVVGAGLIGGLASVIADSAVKDVYYSAIVDIQIRERLKSGVKSDHLTVHWNRSGTSGGTQVAMNEKSDWKVYQTRILSSANKVNLDFADALPSLKSGISQSISGIF